MGARRARGPERFPGGSSRTHVIFTSARADRFPMSAGEVLCRVGLDGKFRYTNLNEFVIGSSTDADLVIPGQGVADRHLKVTCRDGQVTVENLSANSTTRVAGQEVTGRIQVSYKPGDRIQL